MIEEEAARLLCPTSIHDAYYRSNPILFPSQCLSHKKCIYKYISGKLKRTMQNAKTLIQVDFMDCLADFSLFAPLLTFVSHKKAETEHGKKLRMQSNEKNICLTKMCFFFVPPISFSCTISVSPSTSRGKSVAEDQQQRQQQC